MGRSDKGISKNVGSANPFYGKHHSDEQRRRWSEQRKGHGPSVFPHIPAELTKELLEELYVKQKVSRTEISRLTGISDWTIVKALEIYGIAKRPRLDVNRLSNAMREKAERLVTYEGYVQLLRADHHRANKKGYVLEHILVWEEANGRLLPDGWVVHHINGKKDDNRPANLLAAPRRSHHGYLLLNVAQKRIRELETQVATATSQQRLEV